MRHQNSFLTTLATLSFLCSTPVWASDAPTEVSFDDLPAEVKVHIVSYLPLQDLKAFRSTSTECKDIVNDFMRARNFCIYAPQKSTDSEKPASIEHFLRFVQDSPISRVSLKRARGSALLDSFGIATPGMTSLTHLYLSGLDLRAKISQLELSKLQNLTSLSVGNNNLIDHVTALRPLTNLKSLDVGDNNLAGHVTVLQALTNLTHLDVGNNHLIDHVAALRPLTNLKSLDVGDNNLAAHVTALQALTNLTYLNANCNKIADHVTALQALTNLRHLDVTFNNLAGHVTALQSLTNLTSLDVTLNNLADHVTALQSLTNLTSLGVVSNKLRGHVTALQPLTNLTSLKVGCNGLSDEEQTQLTTAFPLMKKLEL